MIVHAGGLTLGTNHERVTQRFSKGRGDLWLEHGSIEIEPAFLEFLINQLKEFIQGLEGEFRALCDETRQLES